MRLVLITPPSVEPVSLTEAKLHARVEYPDDDALISSLITSARRYCETALRGALITQTWALMLDSFPSAGGYYNRAIREIWPSLGGLPSGLGFYPGLVPNSTGVIDIPLPPLHSITSVNYYDFAGVLQTVPSSTYNVSLGTPGRIQPAYSKVWPISRPTIDCVQITFVCGQGNDGTAVSENVKTAIKMMVAAWYEQREAFAQGQFAPVPMCVDALLSPDEPGIYA
jgi:Phage gp6-like head-tail connector protein